ncbi:MAG: AraC family transcriptional regulator [Alphaproteobacteria bacterium]
MQTAAMSLPRPGEFGFPKNALAFETANVREVAPHFANMNAGPAQFCVASEEAFTGFRHSRTPLGRTTMDSFQLDCAGPQEISSTRPLESEFFLFVPYRGGLEVTQGRRRIGVAPGQIAVVSSEGSFTRKRWRDASELLVIGVDRQTLMKTVSDEYGVALGTLLQFERQIVADLDAVPTLWRYIATLCRDAAEAEPCIADPATARSCERTLIMLFLQSFPHSLSARLAKPGSPASPYYVRRVQDFVHANAARRVGAAEMTEVAGVSARALYYGFQKYLGVTPMKYLKHVRLEGARAALRKARGARESVTEIAMSAGYSNLSRFCRDYRAQFGETPSTTMRQN